MSNSSENDEDRFRTGGDVGVRESDRPIIDTESGGDGSTERETGGGVVSGHESSRETDKETEEEKEEDVHRETEGEEGEKKNLETDKESIPESGKDGDVETGSDGSGRDSSLERHCDDYLAKKIGECLLV